MSESNLEEECKALWDCQSHKLLERSGYASDYESQPEIIKMGLRRDVRAVLSAHARGSADIFEESEASKEFEKQFPDSAEAIKNEPTNATEREISTAALRHYRYFKEGFECAKRRSR